MVNRLYFFVYILFGNIFMKEKLNIYLKIIRKVIKSSILIFFLVLLIILIFSNIKNNFSRYFYKYSFLISSIILFFIATIPSMAFTNTQLNFEKYRAYYQSNDADNIYEKLREENYIKSSTIWFIRFIIPSLAYLLLYFILKIISN